mgnify:CR=1 FL=1
MNQDSPELISEGVRSGSLRAATAAGDVADMSLVCVGTPSRENGSLCLDYVARATADIGDYLQRSAGYHVVCIRSTVLPHTVEDLVIPTLEEHSSKKAGRDFGVCMNPSSFARELQSETTGVHL